MVVKYDEKSGCRLDLNLDPAYISTYNLVNTLNLFHEKNQNLSNSWRHRSCIWWSHSAGWVWKYNRWASVDFLAHQSQRRPQGYLQSLKSSLVPYEHLPCLSFLFFFSLDANVATSSRCWGLTGLQMMGHAGEKLKGKKKREDKRWCWWALFQSLLNSNWPARCAVWFSILATRWASSHFWPKKGIKVITSTCKRR